MAPAGARGVRSPVWDWLGEPEDVAAALAFLCSSDAACITGHLLPVDGGLTVRRIALE